MPVSSFLRFFQRSSHSTSNYQRIVYKTIKRQRASRILEIGLTDTAHSQRMLQVAIKSAQGPVEYTGIGLFESGNQGGDGLSLKATFETLGKLGPRIRLIPGAPADALARYANMIHDIDLVVVNLNSLDDPMERGWFYVPRMLNAEAQAVVESVDPTGKSSGRELTYAEIVQKANAVAPRRKAAA